MTYEENPNDPKVEDPPVNAGSNDGESSDGDASSSSALLEDEDGPIIGDNDPVDIQAPPLPPSAPLDGSTQLIAANEELEISAPISRDSTITVNNEDILQG